MPASSKNADQDRTQESSMPPSSELPSSFGDSPKRVTPKDVEPGQAAFRDLKVTDVGSDRASDEGAPQAGPRGAGSDTGHDEDLPASHGDSPQEMTPKDVHPDHASYADATQRDIASANPAVKSEALVDEGSELSFPASDPPAAAQPVSKASEHQHAPCVADEEEEIIDEAIELTFPASDPIAVKSISRIDPDAPPAR